MKNIDIFKLCELVERKTHRTFSFASNYSEPGYSTPVKGILFGNWNPACGFSVNKDVQKRDPISKLARVAEHLGYELEWEDEWATCSDCGKAVRTSPNSYGWTSHYRLLNDGELVCLDCLSPSDYLESIENNPDSACPPQWNPADHGYVKFNGTYETGFHQGQNDDPKAILKALQADGKSGIVFRIAANSQFYTEWEAFFKP